MISISRERNLKPLNAGSSTIALPPHPHYSPPPRPRRNITPARAHLEVVINWQEDWCECVRRMTRQCHGAFLLQLCVHFLPAGNGSAPPLRGLCPGALVLGRRTSSGHSMSDCGRWCQVGVVLLTCGYCYTTGRSAISLPSLTPAFFFSSSPADCHHRQPPAPA